MSITRTTPPAWREGDRIRRADGTGYSDRVSDDSIRLHAVEALTRADDRQRSAEAYDAYWFAMATLALREWERVTTHHP